MGSTLIWLVSLCCKQITVTLPILVFLYEWYFFQDLSQDWLKRSLKWVLGIVVLFVIIVLIYTDFNPLEKFSRLNDFSKNEFTITQRALTQLRVIIYYISLLFYPHPSRLNLDYDFPLSYSLFNPFTTLLSLIIIIGLIVLGLYLARRQRLISFCIFWFLGNLVIESSVIPLAIIFEHRLYLPSMLVSLATVILIFRFIKPAWLSVGIICFAAALFSFWTIERNKIWRDEITLWTDCVNKSPNKARPHSNLGKALSERNMKDEALQNFLMAIQLNPNYVEAIYNLGSLYGELGKTDKAIVQYRKAVEVNPNYVKAHNNLGLALLGQDKTDEALKNFQQALQIDPNFVAAHLNMGLALSKQGKLVEAIEHFRQTLQIDPNLAQARFQLGAALVKQGKPAQGINHLKKALQIDPDYAEAHNNLGGELLRQGKTDEALKHFTAALNTNPDMAEAHNNIGIIRANQGKIDTAIWHFQDALRINPGFELAQDNLRRARAIQQKKMDTEAERIQTALNNNPDDPQLIYELGNVYLAKGKLNRAITQYQQALSADPNFPQALNTDNAANYYNVAVLYALQNNVAESLAWLDKAVTKGYDNWGLIKTDKDLENIRNSEGYRELIKGQ